ncbi:MAG TPA: hypothetical protein VGD67_25765 [Pseudonocardiaceae bacterium]
MFAKFSRLTRTAAATLVAAGAISTAVAAAPAASASVSTQVTYTVCAQDLYVRATAQGVVIGTLFYGEHFRVERYSPSRQWVYGYAYGSANMYGWVQNGWFCHQ